MLVALPTGSFLATSGAVAQETSSVATSVNGSLAERRATKELITIEKGNLPLVLSSPHGGLKKIPGVNPRLGNGVNRFNPKGDNATAVLTEKIADAIESRMGQRPHVVVARFHRRFLDANRNRKDAYESELAGVVYDAYHNALADARQQVVRDWGRGLLLDIHGQGSAPRTVIRGTQNGMTTTHLIDRFGPESLYGKSSLFGEMAKRGLTVSPAVMSKAKENPRYDGGYTVITYGSAGGGTFDAMQLELGADLRSSKYRDTTATSLANAIAAFAESYLPKASRPKLPGP